MRMTTTVEPVPTSTGDTIAARPIHEIVRDIARGGIAGLIVGFLVAGLGGRIVMRLAALAVPSSVGAFTENGNRIGDITLGGSLGLIIFIGLIAAIFFGVVWVVISPWLPGTGLLKGLVAMPIAVALGAFGLIDGRNVDFFVLRHDPLVVAMLIALVALIGPAMALADGWLDRRLPSATASDTGADRAYLTLTLIGGFFGGLLMLQSVFGSESQPLGITIVVTGLVTLAWWYQRVRGRKTPSTILTLAGRTALLIGTVAGYAVLIPEIRSALGIA